MCASPSSANPPAVHVRVMLLLASAKDISLHSSPSWLSITLARAQWHRGARGEGEGGLPPHTHILVGVYGSPRAGAAMVDGPPGRKRGVGGGQHD